MKSTRKHPPVGRQGRRPVVETGPILLTVDSLDRWERRFLNLARHIASWSKDPSTQAGAVLAAWNHRIISVGFNGFPAGIEDDPELYKQRERKYQTVLHAEENALYFAEGRTPGAHLFVWPFPSCAPCAAKIVQFGISKVVAPVPSAELQSRWEDSLALTEQLFNKVGIEYIQVTEEEEERCPRPPKTL